MFNSIQVKYLFNSCSGMILWTEYMRVPAESRGLAASTANFRQMFDNREVSSSVF